MNSIEKDIKQIKRLMKLILRFYEEKLEVERRKRKISEETLKMIIKCKEDLEKWRKIK